MKKIVVSLVLCAIVLGIFLLGFNSKVRKEPDTYYQVYLDDQILGVISSKKKLNEYIDSQGNKIKEKYGVDNVYAPIGLRVKKLTTFSGKVSSVDSVYNKILELSPFTIKGYQFTIKKSDDVIKVNVTDAHIFEEAVRDMIKTFVGTNDYQAYLDGNQLQIITTGKEIQNIYIDEDISYREIYISANETIYTNVSDLSKYLLFGTTADQQKYKVQVGDTIEKVAFDHKISVEEFLISNSKFTSANNLLFPGQEVTIGVTDPKISVVEESFVVEDIESKFKTEEIYDDTLILGDEKVKVEGENGLERVSQSVKKVNGAITFIKPENIETLVPTINKVILIGTRYVPSVGRTSNWAWPTNSGWTISSAYGWRLDPFNGTRSFHQGLDIAGTGYNSPIYAVTNGVVHIAEYADVNGYYVSINHNNGYWTRYMHMISMPIVKPGQIVEQGQIIGYVGSTGAATGPHLHLEVWVGQPYRGGYTISPWEKY